MAHELAFDEFLYALYAFIALSSAVWFLWVLRWVQSQCAIKIWAFPTFLSISFIISCFVFGVFSEWYDDENGKVKIFLMTLSPSAFLLFSYFNNLNQSEETLNSNFWKKPINFIITRNVIVIATVLALTLMLMFGWFN